MESACRSLCQDTQTCAVKLIDGDIAFVADTRSTDSLYMHLDAESIATEQNSAAAHMQDESTDDEISGASDYGTLA